MPKRRMRTAAQIRASRANLEKARKAKGRKTIPRSEYGGKMLTLYHRTNSFAAGKIIKQGFLTGKSNTWQNNPLAYKPTEVYGSTKNSRIISGYGDVAVKFKVSRHKARLDDQFPSGERHYAVNPKWIKKGSIKVLSGKRVKR